MATLHCSSLNAFVLTCLSGMHIKETFQNHPAPTQSCFGFCLHAWHSSCYPRAERFWSKLFLSIFSSCCFEELVLLLICAERFCRAVRCHSATPATITHRPRSPATITHRPRCRHTSAPCHQPSGARSNRARYKPAGAVCPPLAGVRGARRGGRVCGGRPGVQQEGRCSAPQHARRYPMKFKGHSPG